MFSRSDTQPDGLIRSCYSTLKTMESKQDADAWFENRQVYQSGPTA